MKNLLIVLCLLLIGGCNDKKDCLNLESKISELENKSPKVLFDGKWLKGEVYRNSDDPTQNGLVRFFVNESVGEYKRFWAAPFASNERIALTQFDTIYSQLYIADGYYSARNLKKNLGSSDIVYQPMQDSPFGINVHSGHIEGEEHTKIHRNTFTNSQIPGYTQVNVSLVDPITNQILNSQPFNIYVETEDFNNLPTSIDIYWAMKVGVVSGRDVYSLSINHTHQ